MSKNTQVQYIPLENPKEVNYEHSEDGKNVYIYWDGWLKSIMTAELFERDMQD